MQFLRKRNSSKFWNIKLKIDIIKFQNLSVLCLLARVLFQGHWFWSFSCTCTFFHSNRFWSFNVTFSHFLFARTYKSLVKILEGYFVVGCLKKILESKTVREILFIVSWQAFISTLVIRLELKIQPSTKPHPIYRISEQTCNDRLVGNYRYTFFPYKGRMENSLQVVWYKTRQFAIISHYLQNSIHNIS